MNLRTILTVAAVAVGISIPMLAHHSIAAEFDQSKDITVKGTVTKIEWMNPHIWVYLDAKDASGNVVKWQCEGGAPNSLTRNGWTRNALKIGDEVTIAGFPAKNGTNTCNSRQVTLPDGRRVFAGSAAGEGKE